ncbi:MAG: branched-chain amino acid ABC transporter permease, partial [Rhodospirillales bacterium]|nr:branched-chain amino acid ABC transporter permease [Rhodospirillales bacterium]
TLIFGVMRRLNLSYGPSIMVGAFVGTLVYLEFKANAVAIAAATVVGAVIVGIYVERLCFRAIRRGAAVASLVSSFVIWMQLEELVTVVFPDRTYPFPPLVTADPVELGPFFFKLENVVMFACAAAMTVLLHWLLQHTRFGLALRAVSEDPRAALFMGINVGAVMSLAFVIASAFGGVAAYLIVSADGQITPLFGLWATFKGLIAMMLGGMGSIPGAILGGLLLGVVEAHSIWYLGTEYRDLSAYFLLFLFLVFRPGGLMGQLAVERELAATRRV